MERISKFNYCGDKTAVEERIDMLTTNEKGFVLCPKCRKATRTKVLPTTRINNFPLYCQWCKKEFIIDK
jgi:hypothetical protein